MSWAPIGNAFGFTPVDGAFGFDPFSSEPPPPAAAAAPAAPLPSFSAEADGKSNVANEWRSRAPAAAPVLPRAMIGPPAMRSTVITPLNSSSPQCTDQDLVNIETLLQVYQGHNFQLLRFDFTPLRSQVRNDNIFPVDEKLTKLFSKATARFILNSPDSVCILYRPNCGKRAVWLQKSAPDTDIGQVKICHLLHSRRNESLSKWQFEETVAGNAARRKHQQLVDNHFEDHAEYGIAFGDQDAVVGRTAELTRQLQQGEEKNSAATAVTLLRCNRVSDDVKREIFAQITDKNITDESITVLTQYESVQQEKRTQVFLFSEPVPRVFTVLSRTLTCFKDVQSYYNEGTAHRAFSQIGVYYNSRSVGIGTHFQKPDDEVQMHQYETDCSTAVIEVGDERHTGRRLWRTTRVTPVDRIDLNQRLRIDLTPILPPELGAIVAEYTPTFEPGEPV